MSSVEHLAQVIWRQRSADPVQCFDDLDLRRMYNPSDECPPIELDLPCLLLLDQLRWRLIGGHRPLVGARRDAGDIPHLEDGEGRGDDWHGGTHSPAQPVLVVKHF